MCTTLWLSVLAFFRMPSLCKEKDRWVVAVPRSVLVMCWHMLPLVGVKRYSRSVLGMCGSLTRATGSKRNGGAWTVCRRQNRQSYKRVLLYLVSSDHSLKALSILLLNYLKQWLTSKVRFLIHHFWLYQQSLRCPFCKVTCLRCLTAAQLAFPGY